MLVVSFINQSPTFLISFLSFFFPFLLSPFLYVCSFFIFTKVILPPSVSWCFLCLCSASSYYALFHFALSSSACPSPPPHLSSFLIFILSFSLSLFNCLLDSSFFLLLSLSLDLFLLSQFLSSLPLNPLSPGGWSHINQVAGSREWWQ